MHKGEYRDIAYIPVLYQQLKQTQDTKTITEAISKHREVHTWREIMVYNSQGAEETALL